MPLARTALAQSGTGRTSRVDRRRTALTTDPESGPMAVNIENRVASIVTGGEP